ncbi:hypothetical protein F2Q70_00002101 [Brassica cretica]|uniref:Uncharacterized protein n=1 Tax=Brassica cretica TaxID=69181 RepID=A0A8S9IPU7_BRACR|nr:hypothetical protein F2Q70_00002101 [Brassica cretica]
MDTMKELFGIHKPIMLDSCNFGHWKARMRQLIRGIDEDARTAVEEGWSVPTMMTDDKTLAPKPKDRWTDQEKAASNSCFCFVRLETGPPLVVCD